MNRVFTMIALFLAIIVVILALVGIGSQYLLVALAAAIILHCIGSITGQ